MERPRTAGALVAQLTKLSPSKSQSCQSGMDGSVGFERLHGRHKCCDTAPPGLAALFVAAAIAALLVNRIFFFLRLSGPPQAARHSCSRGTWRSDNSAVLLLRARVRPYSACHPDGSFAMTDCSACVGMYPLRACSSLSSFSRRRLWWRWLLDKMPSPKLSCTRVGGISDVIVGRHSWALGS